MSYLKETAAPERYRDEVAALNSAGPVDTTFAALNAADELAERVVAMVADLIGVSPEAAGSAPLRASRDGRLNALCQRAEQTTESVERANYALTRLRNSL